MDFSIAQSNSLQAFQKFAQTYDLNDARAQLKYDHSLRVAALAGRIASESGYDTRAINLAWIAGLLHDVGRFEQLRQYDTFDDAVFPHAHLSVGILQNKPVLRQLTNAFHLSEFEEDLIIDAIRSHSFAQVTISPELNFPTEYAYSHSWLHHILRDADKIDILAYVPNHMDICCGMPMRVLQEDSFNPELIVHLKRKEPIETRLMRKGIDYMARYVSFTYQMVYPISKQILKEQGDVYRMLDFQTTNPETKMSFEQLKAFVDAEIAVEPDFSTTPVPTQNGDIVQLCLYPRDTQV